MRPGDTLGPYRVLGKLGEGGMGEVYRARDTKLDRDVAIKILPELFAADDERVARFEREAKTLASLNHPLIAQIFGLEDSNGVRALVMELVEGPTLAEVIAGLRPQAPDLSSGESRGPKSEARGLPVREALGIARQIAEALEAAHELGIIHRDLKPANVKVRDDGTVKVLDFGLAKAIGPAEAGHYRDGGADVRSVRLQPDLSNAPTITSPAAMTRQGIILGTAAYMPPEQARGRAVDKRADIWAFGAVLFEMLTGKRAFPGEDVSDTLAAVLLAEPDWAAMPAETPPRVGALLRRCLQKDPRERQRDIGDVRLEISEVLGGAPEPQSTLAPSSPRVRSRERLAWIVAAVFCLSTIGVAALGYLARTPADALVQRFSILPPANTALGIASGSLASPVLSPDGRYLAFPLTSAGRPLLWVRPIDSLSPQALQGTDGARYPFWSPDSSAIAFFTTGKLKKIQVSGGPPQTICDAPAGFGGTWNRDGEIVFSPSEFSVLFRVSANGGTATPATTFDRARGEEGHRFPSFLPDGRHFVYLALAGATGSARGLGIDIGALDSAAGRRLLDADTPAVYAGPGRSAQRTGYLLFVRDETLLAQPFDAARLETAGEAVPLATGMAQSTAGGFSASANGVLAYRTGGLERQLVWLDRNGTRLGTLGPVGRYGHVEIAPDGGRVAVDRIDPQSRGWDIWLFDAASGIPARFTFSQPSRNARWSSDGRFILFQKTAEAIFRKPSDGTGNEEVLYEASTGGGMVPSDSSPDGRWFVYRQVSRGTPGSLWVLPLSGERQPKMVAQTEVRGTNGRFSPDGRWMAYASEESGRVEVCVQPYPGSGAKWQVSREGGTFPRWRGDGKELFYVTNGKVMGVPVEGGSSFRAGTAMPLVEVPFGPDVVQAYPYAVTRDGQRFLVIAPVEEAGSSAFTVVLNWTVALQRPQPGTR